MAKSVRKPVVREAALSEVKDDLSRYLREAEKGDIVITRHGKPAGVLIGFASEGDWFDYRLENDPRFLQRVCIPTARHGAAKSYGTGFAASMTGTAMRSARTSCACNTGGRSACLCAARWARACGSCEAIFPATG